MIEAIEGLLGFLDASIDLEATDGGEDGAATER